MKPRSLMVLILALSLIVIFVAPGFGQQKAPEKGVVTKAQEPPKIHIIGKIEYSKSDDSYFIRGDHPFGVRKIANQDPKILEKFSKTHTNVTIEGHGTESQGLFIEKINGKPYEGTAK